MVTVGCLSWLHYRGRLQLQSIVCREGYLTELSAELSVHTYGVCGVLCPGNILREVAITMYCVQGGLPDRAINRADRSHIW